MVRRDQFGIVYAQGAEHDETDTRLRPGAPTCQVKARMAEMWRRGDPRWRDLYRILHPEATWPDERA